MTIMAIVTLFRNTSADVDYDMLSPIETMANVVCSHSTSKMHKKNDQVLITNLQYQAELLASRSVEALTTLHCESRPPKLSTSRKKHDWRTFTIYNWETTE